MLVITIFCVCLGLVYSQWTSNSCGKRPLVPSGDEDYDRIVGGVESLRGDWAWSCSMRYNGNHICGGSLINGNWIVTAGHCVNILSSASAYTWACGLHDRTGSDTWTQIFTSKRFIRHPNYNGRLIQYDIALFELVETAQLSNYVHPVCLTPNSAAYAGHMSIATGWGSTISGGSSAPTHREVSMVVLTDASCQAKYSHIGDVIIPATQVCAGEKGQNKDTCQGDSGGPLVVKDNNKWYLLGITSWGEGCGDGGVYTRPSGFHDWIIGYTGPLPTGD